MCVCICLQKFSSLSKIGIYSVNFYEVTNLKLNQVLFLLSRNKEEDERMIMDELRGKKKWSQRMSKSFPHDTCETFRSGESKKQAFLTDARECEIEMRKRKIENQEMRKRKIEDEEMRKMREERTRKEKL